MIHDRLTLPVRLFRGLTEKRFVERTSTIYHLYQTEFGITVTRAHERARAAGIDRISGRILGLAPGTPVMQVRRTALTFGDKPVEYRMALDQGTSSSRSIIFDRDGRIVSLSQQELVQMYPRPGWVEHDPTEIWRTQLATARRALHEAGLKARDPVTGAAMPRTPGVLGGTRKVIAYLAPTKP